MRTRVVVLGLVLTFSWSFQASAQVLGTGVMPVVEVGANLVQNSITAVQSVITATNMVLELIPLDDIVIAVNYAEDMGLIGEILTDAEGLLQDVTTVQQLFNPYDIPTDMTGMRQRIAALNEATYKARNYSLKAQTLIVTLLSTVEHLTSLVGHIAELTGNLSANQTLVQVESTMSKTLTTLTVQTASQQRGDTLDSLRKQVILEMDREMTRQYWGPWFEVYD